MLHFSETTGFDLYLHYDVMTPTAAAVEIPVVLSISSLSCGGRLTPLCRRLQSHAGVDRPAGRLVVDVPVGERLGPDSDVRALGRGGVPERVCEGGWSEE